MSFFILFIAGLLAYLLSTLAGGGGALILLPIVGFFLAPHAVAPVLNLGNMIGRPARLILFWKYINWKLVYYYVPSAWLGALFGAFIFVKLNAGLMYFLLGAFLIISAIPFNLGRKKAYLKMKPVYFIPIGFIVSFISTVFGATGAVLNPFYLNMGLVKEELIATKTANSFFTGIAQISAYVFWGALDLELGLWGLSIGLGAIIGNIFGKKILEKISELNFRRAVVVLMWISGLMMLYKGFESL